MRKPVIVQPIVSGAREGALRPLIGAPLELMQPRFRTGLCPGDVQVSFRRLHREDAPLLKEHLLSLPAEDRWLRFCGPIQDERIITYCTGLDWSRVIVVGCFVDGVIRGAAELIPAPDTPGHAELGIAVQGGYKQHGLGSELLRRVIVLARNRFLSTIRLVFLSENRSMRRLAKKFGAELSRERSEIEGRIRPSWPSYATMIEELQANGEAFMRAAFNLDERRA